MTARNVRLHSIPSAPPLVRCSSNSLRSHTGPVLSRLTLNDDAPGFVTSFLTGSCSLPLLAPCFASCSSLCSVQPLTLSDSRPHDDPLMRVVTGARSGRCGHPLPASRRFQGGTATPFAPRPYGTASSSPKGEAVIMKDALRAITFSGAFCKITGFQ